MPFTALSSTGGLTVIKSIFPTHCEALPHDTFLSVTEPSHIFSAFFPVKSEKEGNMAKDLRRFLSEYEKRHPEEVIHIEKEIGWDQEVTVIAQKFEKQEKYPILIFHNIRTCSGERSPFPLITNLLASRNRCAEVGGCCRR
jgi:hypothetical protein